MIEDPEACTIVHYRLYCTVKNIFNTSFSSLLTNEPYNLVWRYIRLQRLYREKRCLPKPAKVGLPYLRHRVQPQGDEELVSLLEHYLGGPALVLHGLGHVHARLRRVRPQQGGLGPML